MGCMTRTSLGIPTSCVLLGGKRLEIDQHGPTLSCARQADVRRDAGHATLTRQPHNRLNERAGREGVCDASYCYAACALCHKHVEGNARTGHWCATVSLWRRYGEQDMRLEPAAAK